MFALNYPILCQLVFCDNFSVTGKKNVSMGDILTFHILIFNALIADLQADHLAVPVVLADRAVLIVQFAAFHPVELAQVF